MTRTMYDSINANDIPLHAPMVAGYIDGPYAWSTAMWNRFPNAIKVPIATRASSNDGLVLDVEPGDATPDQAVQWVVMRRNAGVFPSIYCNQLNTWPLVTRAFGIAGIPHPPYWVARYDNDPTIPAGAVAKQYASPAVHKSGHFDLSNVVDYWPGIDTTKGTDMIFGRTRDNPDVYVSNGVTRQKLKDMNHLSRMAAAFGMDPNRIVVVDDIDALGAPVYETLTNLTVAGIDYARLAQAVNDDAARRLAQ